MHSRSQREIAWIEYGVGLVLFECCCSTRKFTVNYILLLNITISYKGEAT